jgi:hypothetical protein
MTINCSPFNGFAKVSVCGGACLRGGGPVDRSSETRSRARGGGNVCTGRRCRQRPQGRRRSRRQATRSARSRQPPGCAGPQRRAQVHPAGRGHCRVPAADIRCAATPLSERVMHGNSTTEEPGRPLPSENRWTAMGAASTTSFACGGCRRIRPARVPVLLAARAGWPPRQ